MAWSLVSPASKGIGFHLARNLLQTTKIPVVATARSNLDETRDALLQGLDAGLSSRLTLLQVDVTSMSSHYPLPVRHKY